MSGLSPSILSSPIFALGPYDPYNNISYLDINKRKYGGDYRDETDRLENRYPPPISPNEDSRYEKPLIKKLYLKRNGEEKSEKFALFPLGEHRRLGRNYSFGARGQRPRWGCFWKISDRFWISRMGQRISMMCEYLWTECCKVVRLWAAEIRNGLWNIGSTLFGTRASSRLGLDGGQRAFRFCGCIRLSFYNILHNISWSETNFQLCRP